MKIGFVIKLVTLLIIISFCFFIYAIWNSGINYTSNKYNAELTGQIGDFVGGIFGSLLSFLSILYVIENMNLQKKQISIQESESIQNRLDVYESFFELKYEVFKIEIRNLIQDENKLEFIIKTLNEIDLEIRSNDYIQKKHLKFFRQHSIELGNIVTRIIALYSVLFHKLKNEKLLDTSLKNELIDKPLTFELEVVGMSPLFILIIHSDKLIDFIESDKKKTILMKELIFFISEIKSLYKIFKS